MESKLNAGDYYIRKGNDLHTYFFKLAIFIATLHLIYQIFHISSPGFEGGINGTPGPPRTFWGFPGYVQGRS